MAEDDFLSELPDTSYGASSEGLDPDPTSGAERGGQASPRSARPTDPPRPDPPGASTYQAPPAEPEGGGQPEAAGAAEDNLCVMMGPVNSGKTYLVASFDQACGSPAFESHYKLEYSGSPATAELSKLAVKTITRGQGAQVKSTENVEENYRVTLTATKPASFWQVSQPEVARLSIWDGPGGTLFPTEALESSQNLKNFEKELIHQSRRAKTIIFCVDVNFPQLEILASNLGKVLARLSVPYTPQPQQPSGYRILRKLRLAEEVPQPKEQHRLAADRFLLLFTKIDVLVSNPIVSGSGSKITLPADRVKPGKLARHLSPLNVAYQFFGVNNLVRIDSMLKPGAQFAVGLCSCWGFHPVTERAFMADNKPVGPDSEDPERRVLMWNPFGVREALLFATTGHAEGPIEIVERDQLGRTVPSLPLDIRVIHSGDKNNKGSRLP